MPPQAMEMALSLKRKHWRASHGIFGLQAAPVLVFMVAMLIGRDI
jgi:hypothetical protein